MDRISQIVNYFHDDDYVDFVAKLGKREANAIFKRAMKIGSEVDSAIRSEVNGLEVPAKLSPEARLALKGWESYKADHPNCKFKTLDRFSSLILNVTGEIDLLCEVHGRLVSLKVASEIRPSYWIQEGGYCILLEEVNIIVEEVEVVRFCKQVGIYEPKNTTKIAELKNLFLSNLNMMRFWRGDYEHDYFDNS